MFSLCVRGITTGVVTCVGGPAWLGVVVTGGAVIVAVKALDAKASGKARKG